MKRWTIEKLVEEYRQRTVSPVEIVNQYLERIDQHDEKYNSFITIVHEKALAQAKLVEARLLAGEEAGLLAGIPITYKDNIGTKGILTTNGSAIDKDHVPEEDSDVVHLLNSAGAIQLGKNNLDEYAGGIESNNYHFGPVRNPWDTALSPGGSSGGSGAAVAANFCLASIGTDTGGSIRVPAALCGTVGLKPTHGLVPVGGVTLNSWTLDHVGPLTANVIDQALVMEALTGINYRSACREDIRGMRIGVPVQLSEHALDTQVKRLFQEALKTWEELGAILIEVDAPFLDEPVDTCFAISSPEKGYLHRERMETSFSLYSPAVQERMKAIPSIPASKYIYGLKKREEFINTCNRLFQEEIDILLTPTTPAPPQVIGVEQVALEDSTESIFQCMIRYTYPFNMTGSPAMTIPCGVTDTMLPVGLQLVAEHHRENILFRAAYAFEQHHLQPFYKLRDEHCMPVNT